MGLDLGINIEMGGASDKLAKGLSESTSNLGKDMVSSAGMGAAEVVASTGMNFGNGDTDQIIADNISAAISLTGTQGLTNLAGNLENYSQQLTAMGLNAPEELVNILLEQIGAVLAEGGVMDAIKKSMDVTANTVDLAKTGLNVAMQAATITGNLQTLLLKLNKMQDVECTCIPSVKDTTSALAASIINQIKAQYEALKDQLIILYNSMICTSNDAALDNVIVSVNNILYVIEPAIDPILQKYTGFTVAEVRNICNQGFAYYGMIKRAAKKHKADKEKENKTNKDIEEKFKNEIKNAKEKLKNASKEEKEEIKKQIKEKKEQYKKELIEKSKAKWKEKTKDLSKEEAKKKLLEWLSEQSIILQNAFHLLIIKDTIEQIKILIEQLQNTSIENQVDLLNTLNNIIEIFEMLGVRPDAKGITLDDLKKLGIAVAGTAVATAVNIGDQVQQNAEEYTQNMIDEANAKIAGDGKQVLTQNVLDDARGTVAGVSDTAYNFVAQGGSAGSIAKNTAGAVGSDIITSGVDQTINTIIDAGLNMDMVAIANGDIPTVNTNAFDYTQTNKDKNIYIDITINKNPSLHLIAISSFISSFKYGNGKAIFNNGATKQIKDAFKETWETGDILTLEIKAKVETITKIYIFTFTANKTNNEDEETDINDQNSLNGQTTSLLSNKSKSLGNISANLDTDFDPVGNLSKVDIVIDAALIEEVLKGKILMFDEIIQMLKLLLPVIDVLKIICHLLENWLINKAFERTKQHVDLSNAIRNATQLINGLKDIISLKDTNFFVIRTQEMADWAKNTFNQTPDESGLITINILQTTALNTYCALHFINPEVPLDLLKGTTLYFDKWSIQNGGYNDGTIEDIDNIEINLGTNEIFYDKNQRSTISSEILRAKQKNIDPNYIDIPELGENNKQNIQKLLDNITFKSDEAEGQQTLRLSDLNLCEPTQLADEIEPKKSAVIVEFGDEYTLGEAVQYSLTIKPGQAINKDTVLGYINNQPIKTKFTGTVRSINNNSDFYHIYPSVAKRHFIIDDPKPCMPVDYNINDVISLQQKFKKSIELEVFILNCLMPSVLPILLSIADRDNKNELQNGAPIPTSNWQTGTVYDSYDEIINNYDNDIADYIEQLLEKNSADNIKSNIKNENINDSLNASKQLMEEIKAIRKAMIDYSIKTYESTIINDTIKGDYSYKDCLGLAFNDTYTFKRVDSDDNKIEYTNYYVNLLKTIPDSKNNNTNINLNIDDIKSTIKEKMKIDDTAISSNQFFDLENIVSQINDNNKEDNEPNYILKYKELIKNIIDRRLSQERSTKRETITQFNQYYKHNIKDINNAFDNLYNRLSKDDLLNTDKVLQQIKIDKLYSLYNVKLDPSSQDYSDYDSSTACNKGKEKKYRDYYDTTQQALTLFMYLVNADINENLSVPFEISNIKANSNDKNNLKYVIGTLSSNYVVENNQIIINATYNNKVYSDFEELYDDILNDKTNEYINSNKNLTSVDSLNDSQKSEIKENTIQALSILLNLNNILTEYIIDALKVIGDTNNTYVLTDEELAYFNRKINEQFYTLVQQESKEILEFWKEVISLYKGEYNLDNIIKEIQEYANNMNSAVDWPQSITFNIDGGTYELYTFMNIEKNKKEIGENSYNEEIPNKFVIPEPVIDLTNLPEVKEPSDITIFDYEYWLVYMLNATLFTLLPMYWSDGLDIPPFMVPTPLPAIYFPIAPPVMVPVVNVLFVFGIALRGIWPAPIILMINLSSSDIDVMVFLKIALEIIKDIFKQMQEYVENGIPMMANQMLNNYITENKTAQKAIEKFRTYSSIIRAIPVEDKALIEKEFNEALVNEMNNQEKVNNALGKLQVTKDNLNEKSNEIKRNIANEIDEAKANATKKFDRRQVITREADLGNGPEPM